MRATALLPVAVIVALTVTSPLAITAQYSRVAVSFDTGAGGKGLAAGAVDPQFTWNHSGDFSEPRYSTRVFNRQGHPLWIGYDDRCTCVMAMGACWTNIFAPDVPPTMPPYDGVEYLYFEFSLPADASDIQLDVASLGADDRVVLLVNDHEVGGFTSRVSSPTAGVMHAGDGAESTHTFKPTSQYSVIDDQSLFNVGDKNVLTFWVNNTGSSNLMAPARSHLGDPDISLLNAHGAITFGRATSTVPATTEPSPTATILRPTAVPATPTQTPTPTATGTPSVVTPPGSPSPSTSPTVTPAASSAPRSLYLPVASRKYCRSARLYADIVLAMDVSTTMLRTTRTGRPKIEAVQDAARGFVDLASLSPDRAGGHDRVAIVAFNSTAWVAQPMTPDSGLLHAAVGNLSNTIAEGTRLDLAIIRGAEALDGAAQPAANELVLILLTDGLPNRVPTPQPAGTQEDVILALSQQVKEQDVRIYTIGVGIPGALDIADRINPELLSEVATDPSMYFETPNAEDLARVYSDIAVDVRGECP